MAIDRSKAAQKTHSPMHISNWGFDEEFQLPAVENLEYDPGGSMNRVVTENLTSAYDYDGSGNPIYIGKATAGSAKSTAVWQIKKLTWDGNNLTDIQWANGNTNYDNVWNNRASLSYS